MENNFRESLSLIDKAVKKIGAERIWIAPSCSLLHSPCDLDLETNDKILTPEIKQWMAFAKQKIDEVVTLKQLSAGENTGKTSALLEENTKANESRKTSALIHNKKVKERVNATAFADFKYPKEIGPGVYDIHSPRVPSKEEMVSLMEKSKAVVPAEQLWVNPDCGLKTRQWDETKKALTAMVEAAKELRSLIPEKAHW